MILRNLNNGDYICIISETGLITNISFTCRVDIQECILLQDESTGGHIYLRPGVLKYFLVNKETNWTNCFDTSYFNKQLKKGIYSTIYLTEIKNETTT